MEILIEKHQLSANNKMFKEVDTYCLATNNLFNSTLYQIRQHYFETGSFSTPFGSICSSETMYHMMKNTPEFNTENHERVNKHLNTKVLKQVYINIEEAFKSFFALLQTPNLNQKPNLPNYRTSGGRYVAVFPKDALSIKDGWLFLAKRNTNIKVKTKITEKQSYSLWYIQLLKLSRSKICFQAIQIFAYNS